MTDAELDQRCKNLTDADLRLLASNGWCDDGLNWYRPLSLLKELASQLLEHRRLLSVKEPIP